jgi:DNA-directed RNA polymerase subunit beta
VKDGKVTDEVVYLSAMEEGQAHVAQANAELDAKGKFTDDLVVCRHAGDVIMVPRDRVDSWTCRRSSSSRSPRR